MRIVHLIPYFPPAKCFGGVPEAVYSLVLAQARLGHDVYVLTTTAGLEDEINRPGLTLHWHHNQNLRVIGKGPGFKVFYVANRFPRLAEQCKVFTAPFWNSETAKNLPESFDILHVHEVHIPGYGKIVPEVQTRGAAVCLSCHGSLLPPVHRGWKKRLHQFFDPYLRKGWFENVDRYFALSNLEKDQLCECGVPEEKIVRMPHGCPVFAPPFEKLPFTISENSQFPTFLYLGRINENKGVGVILEAYLQLVKIGLLARLIFCGPEEGFFDQIAWTCKQYHVHVTQEVVLTQAGVYVLPEINRQAIPTLFSYADYLLCPSPYESFGLVPIESLLCGTPVIATTAYGCLEHIPNPPPTLHIVPPDDPVAFYELMLDVRVRDKTNPVIIPPDSLLPSWDAVARNTCDIYSQLSAV